MIWKNTSRSYGMKTLTYKGIKACTINGKVYNYIKDRCDIEFGYSAGGTSLWDYRISGTVPSGSGSFYNAFLHELGHALGLVHVINHNALMYYFIDIDSS